MAARARRPRSPVAALALAAAWAAAVWCAAGCGAGRSAAAVSGEAARAPTTIVPDVHATSRGELALQTLITESPRTYQLGIASAQLTGIPVGAVINGLSVRASAFRLNEEEWPTAPRAFSACMVQIGPAKPLAEWKKTLADNFAAPPTVVRRGPMTIPPRTFTAVPTLPAGQPNRFGTFFWDFKTPFLYEGGDLAILITHLGGAGGQAMFFDAAPSDEGRGFVARTGEGYDAREGVVTSFTIVRLHHGYGTACAGTGDARPNLVLSDGRAEGAAITLALGNGPPAAPAGLYFGVERTSATLANGCTLLTPPGVFVLGALDGSGRLQVDVTVPASASRLAVQAVVVDAGAPGGFTLSNGVELEPR